MSKDNRKWRMSKIKQFAESNRLFETWADKPESLRSWQKIANELNVPVEVTFKGRIYLIKREVT